jgi:DUF1707 SHOCT-like domain/NPCBM/NEW2 domain
VRRQKTFPENARNAACPTSEVPVRHGHLFGDDRSDAHLSSGEVGAMAADGTSHRIGTAERSAAQQALDAHLNAGRLTIEEYSARSAVAANATTAGELADLFADLPAPRPKLPGIRGGTGRSRWIAFGAAAGALLLVGVAVVLVNSGHEQSSPAPIATATPTAAPPTSAVPTPTSSLPTGTGTDDGNPTASASAGEAKYLADLDPVDRSTYGQIFAQSATANGAFYGHSVVFYNECGNNQGGDIWAEYNLSRAYTRFTATVGVSDDDPAAAQGTYRILVDGAQVSAGDVASGRSTPIQLDVTNALHIRLVVNNRSATQSCAQKATPVHNVWGNAQVS